MPKKNRRPSVAWKRNELSTARRLGTTRNPSDGRPTSDIDDEFFSYEHKQRKTLPSWFKAAIEQSIRNCKDGREPALILCEIQQGRKASKFVVVDLDIWIDIIRKLEINALEDLIV